MPAVPLSQVAVQLRPEDNIAVAARDLAPGMELLLESGTVTVEKRIGLGHKIALRDIPRGRVLIDGVDIQHCGPDDLLPAEGQQLVGQAGGSFRALADLSQIAGGVHRRFRPEQRLP